jgi:hypothetical protein
VPTINSNTAANTTRPAPRMPYLLDSIQPLVRDRV